MSPFQSNQKSSEPNENGMAAVLVASSLAHLTRPGCNPGRVFLFAGKVDDANQGELVQVA